MTQSPDKERAYSSVVIVGAGHAGGVAAASLRQAGHLGSITLVGEELVPPYQRPPLSKAYLMNQSDVESLKLRPDHFYREQRIDLHLGVTVASINRAERAVTTSDRETIHYDFLIVATGARARKLDIPGVDCKGVHELRSIADSESLRGAFQSGHRIAIVGGGYVGLEAAASARAMNADVTVLERESRLLARVASPNVAGFFQNYHAERGVRIVCGASVVAIESDRHQWIKAVHLADGEAIACDAALIGVGAVACESIAADAGLPCTNGIEVNHQSRTSDPSVFAIGDVTSRPVQVYDDRMVRLESVPNALEQAKQAVHAILGLEPPAPEVPWFWSDQYDIKLQIAGLSFQCDDFLVRGSAANPPFAVYHMQAGRVLAVEAINSPQDFMIGKRLIASRKAVDRDKLVDSSISIKSLLI